MARPSSRSILSRPGSGAQLPGGGIFGFFGESISELRRCVWPTRQETIRLSYIVIIIAGLVGTLLGFLDFVLTQTFTRYVIS